MAARAAADVLAPPREVCARCRRPAVVCVCASLVSLPTRTRVVIVQHPRERRVAINTARLAHLCLPSSRMFVTVDVASEPGLPAALADDAVVIFPGPHATDLDALIRAGQRPRTLVVLDGTWWQARKLLQRNPLLQALPQIRFVPPRLSNYRIRREPADHCVATIEALAHVLGVLEGEPERMAGLLRPFDSMVDAQLGFIEGVRAGRRRRAVARSAAARIPAPLAALRDAWPRRLLVVGEANAWPTRRGAREPAPAEIIHWLAVRPETGERFEAVVAPRTALAPAIPHHVDLSPEILAAGESWASASARWRAFVRPDDAVVTWGHYAAERWLGEGGTLPGAAPVDARWVARVLWGAVGSIEACAAARATTAPEPLGQGRGGRRLGALQAVTDALRARW